MAQCTWQNVLDAARAELNDVFQAGGTVWTNTRLQPIAAKAYRKMFDAFDGIANNRVRHTVYFNLAPNTNIWSPVPNGITDMAEPEILSERGALTTGSITSTDTSSPIRAAATNHGLATNADVVITGVSNTMAPWGRWFITVIDANTFSLNGSVSDGAAGTGGTFSFTKEKFIDLLKVSFPTDNDPNSSLINYWWENEALGFVGATTLRQLRLTYIASGTAPTNTATTINIDNCLNFLATATAGYAAQSNGWYQMADRLLLQAFGSKGEADSSGGMLRDLIAPSVLQMQAEPRFPKTFRPSKNALTPYWS